MKKARPNLKRPPHPNYIRQWRKFRNDMSQETLAARVHETLGREEEFSHASVSRIETGKQSYTQPVLEAIADALNCTPADLLIRNPLDTDAPWSIYDTLKKADPDTRTRVMVAVVEALAKTGT